MRKEDFYDVFEYGDRIRTGVELKIEHSTIGMNTITAGSDAFYQQRRKGGWKACGKQCGNGAKNL